MAGEARGSRAAAVERVGGSRKFSAEKRKKKEIINEWSSVCM